MGTHACHLRTWEVRAVEYGLQDHPQLRSELKTSLGYVTPYLKKKKSQQKKIGWGSVRETCTSAVEHLPRIPH